MISLKSIILSSLVILFTFLISESSIAQEDLLADHSIVAYLYANNVLYSMDQDGSNKTEILQRAGIQDFVPLNDGRFLIHTKQYDGESLEVFEPESGVSVLIEFTEGIFTNIAVSDDNSVVAYEVKHMPISTEGDGIWLYKTEGNKSHIKVSGSALTIESVCIHRGRVYLLYHELDLISDEAGLFLEYFPIESSTESKKTRIKEGLKLLTPGGYTVGYIYPATGRRLEAGSLDGGTSFDTEIPSGDILLEQNGFYHLPNQKLAFLAGTLGEEEPKYILYAWDISLKKVGALEVGNIADVGGFAWSPDGYLYFSGRYEDKSGARTEPMIFRYDHKAKKTELFSVESGILRFLKK